MGKTIQAISLIMAHRQEGQPSEVQERREREAQAAAQAAAQRVAAAAAEAAARKSKLRMPGAPPPSVVARAVSVTAAAISAAGMAPSSAGGAGTTSAAVGSNGSREETPAGPVGGSNDPGSNGQSAPVRDGTGPEYSNGGEAGPGKKGKTVNKGAKAGPKPQIGPGGLDHRTGLGCEVRAVTDADLTADVAGPSTACGSHDHDAYGTGGYCGATLVLCPVVAVIQWRQEIARYTTPGAVKVAVYHGPNRRADVEALQHADVVLSTYNTIEADYRKAMLPTKITCEYCGKR